MKIETKRVCIYPKDVQCLTGKSYRQSVRMLQKLKLDMNKKQKSLVSIDEFCSYTGLKYELVNTYING